MFKKSTLYDNIIMIILAVLFGITLFFILCKASYNGDNFFMFANARVLLKDGFVAYDPLSMHSDFAYVIPQWLFSLVIQFLRTNIGDSANYIFLLVLLFTILILMLSISKIVAGENNYIIPVVITYACFVIHYSYLRPYLVTVVCNLSLIYLLEKWKFTDSNKWIYCIPIISVIQINFHNSLWISFFLIILCYLAEEFIHFCWKRPNKLKIVVLMSFVSFVVGFINPYGIDYMTYIFKSLVSLSSLSKKITELKPSGFTFDGGLLCYLVAGANLILGAYLIIKNKTRIPLRYALLFLGFFIMGIISVRNNLFFFTSGQVLFMYLFSKIRQLGNISVYKWAMRFMSLAAVVIAVLYIRMDITSLKPDDKDIYYSAEYLSLIEDDKSVPVFSTFNTGSFLEFFEMKPYIDARAEIYGIANNGVKDVASEYVYLMDTATEKEFMDFMNEYGFIYALSDSKKFNDFLDGSKSFILLKEEGDTKLYERR